MKIEPRDIDSLIEIFEASKWDEMHLQVGDVEIFLSTDPAARLGDRTAATPTSTSAPAVSPPPSERTSAASAPSVPAHWVAIRAPNLGTFYRAPKPGAPPFVEVGAAIDVDTELCLIEVMKLFTTLKAGVKGVLKQACVKDAVMVEHNDVLFYIEPA
jgi:acetyl-CoA carboxylase biotin carboxyl carrier protein